MRMDEGGYHYRDDASDGKADYGVHFRSAGIKEYCITKMRVRLSIADALIIWMTMVTDTER